MHGSMMGLQECCSTKWKTARVSKREKMKCARVCLPGRRKKRNVYTCECVRPNSKKYNVHVYVCLAKGQKMKCARVCVCPAEEQKMKCAHKCVSVRLNRKNEMCTCMCGCPKRKKWTVHIQHVRMGIQKINFDWFNSFTPVMYAHVWPKAVTKIQKWSPQFLHHAVKSASTNIGDTAILISPSDQASKNTSSSTLK